MSGQRLRTKRGKTIKSRREVNFEKIPQKSKKYRDKCQKRRNSKRRCRHDRYCCTDKNSTLRTPVCFYVLRGGTYPVSRQIRTRRNGLFEPLNRVEIGLFAKFRKPIRRVRRFVVGIIVCYVKRAISRRTTRDLKLTFTHNRTCLTRRACMYKRVPCIHK